MLGVSIALEAGELVTKQKWRVPHFLGLGNKNQCLRRSSSEVMDALGQCDLLGVLS